MEPRRKKVAAKVAIAGVAAKIRGEVLHKAVEEAMGEQAALAPLLPLLTDRETLKVIHRKLHDLGWQRPWGYDQHHALYKALCEFFGDDDDHLRS